MFHASILELESQIQYHQEQQQLAEQELDRLKMNQAIAEEAVDKVKETLEHLDDKYLEVFKEHLLSLFSNNKTQEVKEEAPVEVKTEVTEEVKSEKSYYELTGRPDLRPTIYEDLAPNVTYSSDGRAYVGFNDRQEAEKFRDAISEPSLLDDAVIMNGFKYEVKFHCKREYVQEIANSINSMSEEVEEAQTPNFEKIDIDLTYNHVDKICYIAHSSKSRADNYGIYLTKILDIGKKYTVSKDPQIVDAKYELRIEGISFEDTLELQNFNLKKEWDAKENKDARSLWRDTRKREVKPACKPLPRTTSINEIELGNIVYLNSHSNQYKVLQKVELDGISHLEVICVYNSERPSLVGAISYLKECYKVLPDDIQIDPSFSSVQEEQEEVLTETVAVYKPKEKPVLKKVKTKAHSLRSQLPTSVEAENEELSESDFPSGPYQKISLDEIEVCDIVSTGTNVKGYYEVYQHCGDYVLGRCLYHDSLKMRIGQDGYYIKQAFLVEKCSQEMLATA